MSALAEALTELQEKWTTLLAERAASNLARRPCVVIFEPPHIRDLDGVMTRDGRAAHIRIRPGMTASKTLHVLLHEAAHAKLHFAKIAPSDNHKKPPASYHLTDEAAYRKSQKKMDDEANDLAATWLDYANKNAEDGKLTDKLIALLGMKL
jgi:hypothetical protein